MPERADGRELAPRAVARTAGSGVVDARERRRRGAHPARGVLVQRATARGENRGRERDARARGRERAAGGEDIRERAESEL